MTEDEKRLLQEAARLLDTGTSNALIPVDRQRWTRERNGVVARLREMAS